MIPTFADALAKRGAAGLIAVALLSGCGPAFYGQYPPRGYYGGPVQQMAPIQMAPGQMAPPTLVQPQTGNGGAPATFQNGTTPSSLNDVPSVSPVEAMNLPPNPKPTTWHTVKPGETFTSISQSYGVPLDVLMKANFFDQVPNLTPGQHIMIP